MSRPARATGLFLIYGRGTLPPMAGYYVQIESGPAAGWGYHTSIAPAAVIHVAPIPDRNGEWMRVAAGEGDHPWPGEERYTGEELPKPDETIRGAAILTDDGDVIVRYWHTETY